MERQSFSAKIFPKPSSSGIVYKDKNHFSHLWTQQNRSTEGKSPNMSTNEGKKKKKKGSESLDSVTFIFQKENSALSPLCKPGLSFYICKIRINNMISFCRRTSIFLGFIGKSSECF